MSNQLDIFNPRDEENIRSWARFSACRKWRWELGRTWTRQPMLCAIGLNPSKADEEDNDPTVRRWIGFAKREGFGGLIVGNLFGWITTDPKGLRTAVDPVGSENDIAIKSIAVSCGTVLVSWGALHSKHDRDRAKAVIEMLRDLNVRIMCLGVTKNGEPRHPLYLRRDTPMEIYDVSA